MRSIKYSDGEKDKKKKRHRYGRLITPTFFFFFLQTTWRECFHRSGNIKSCDFHCVPCEYHAKNAKKVLFSYEKGLPLFSKLIKRARKGQLLKTRQGWCLEYESRCSIVFSVDDTNIKMQAVYNFFSTEHMGVMGLTGVPTILILCP